VPFGPLVDPSFVREHRDELTLVDCRFALGEPGAGERAYLAGHVPGAAFLDLDRDLAAPPGDRGRHPLPAAEDFAAAAGRAGIRRDRPVVAYDEAGEGGAARLWWLLRHHGHDAVAVLDGGLRAWREAGGPLREGVEEVEPGDVVAGQVGEEAVELEELRGLVVSAQRAGDEPAVAAEDVPSDGAPPRRPIVLDARAPERFRGEHEPIDPVAGHIPGARNLPFAELAPAGRFLDPERLRERFAAHGVGEGADAIAYCGSGVTASVLVLAATVAGIRPPRLYAGSWSEWARQGLPPERG
jgi:thiosulfate/3-mercaptopyruvate sulfurtransferase